MVPRRSSSFVRSHAIAKAEWRVSLVLRAIAVAGFAALSVPTDGRAQFCFRGRPLPECKSQALTEFMLGARFTEAQPLAENLLVASAELGGLVNATSRAGSRNQPLWTWHQVSLWWAQPHRPSLASVRLASPATWASLG